MKVEVYPSASIFEEKREWRWRVKASNGRILADSGESYERKGRCIQMAEKLFPTFNIEVIGA